MNIQRYAKQEVALGQLATALRLYFEGGDIFSVITLAAAAEEILGELLRGRGGGPQARNPIAGIFQLLRLRKGQRGKRPKTPDTDADAYLHMDAGQEAHFLLGRAIDDYLALSGTLSSDMLRFKRETPAKT